MKKRISITLSRDVIATVDRMAGPRLTRSAVIERVLRGYIKTRTQVEVEACDLARINTATKKLNSESRDVLEYQAAGRWFGRSERSAR